MMLTTANGKYMTKEPTPVVEAMIEWYDSISPDEQRLVDSMVDRIYNQARSQMVNARLGKLGALEVLGVILVAREKLAIRQTRQRAGGFR